MIKPICKQNYSNISFGSIERTVYNNGNKDDIKYRNNTYMFRRDLNWDKVVDEITKDDIPKKIYCYACSDGSEPYSIAIALITKLGWDKAQKYFPIIARDVDEEMINKANTGILTLLKEDIERIEKYQEKSGVKFFKNISKKMFCFQGEVSDELKSCVDFKVGDICEDSYDIDYNNAVIFFRNAMPYLKNEDRARLLATFARNINDTTAIVIGQFDKDAIRMPLWEVQNHTFGMVETTKNYYVGKRLRDMPRISYTCITSDDYSYLKYVPDIRENMASNYNKFTKSQIMKNNLKVKSSDKETFTRR